MIASSNDDHLVYPLQDGSEEAQESSSYYKYRDYSNIPSEEMLQSAISSFKHSGDANVIHSQKFPVKLYAILSQKSFSDIITWMPHGRSWQVLKPALFESLVMPLFFEYNKYHSFTRLVNAWSFRRVNSGPDQGSYYHELFLRGRPHLHKLMHRLQKSHKKMPMKKQDEPDFYKISKTNPLPELEDETSCSLSSYSPGVFLDLNIPGTGLIGPRQGLFAASLTIENHDSSANAIGSLMGPKPNKLTQVTSPVDLGGAASQQLLGMAMCSQSASYFHHQRLRHMHHVHIFQQLTGTTLAGADVVKAETLSTASPQEELAQSPSLIQQLTNIARNERISIPVSGDEVLQQMPSQMNNNRASAAEQLRADSRLLQQLLLSLAQDNSV